MAIFLLTETTYTLLGTNARAKASAVISKIPHPNLQSFGLIQPAFLFGVDVAGPEA